MFSALLRVRFKALWNTMFGRGVGSGSRSLGKKVGIAILMVYAGVTLVGAIAALMSQMAPAMAAAGLLWLYFTLTGLAAVGLGFIGSVFMTRKELFSATDTGLLLSLPIPPWMILASRMLVLLVLDYVYTALILVPAAVVLTLTVGMTPVMWVCFVIGLLSLPLLEMALTCFVGWLISLLARTARAEKIVVTVLTVALMLGYFYVCFNMDGLMTALLSGMVSLSETMVYVWPLYAFGRAACGEWLYLLQTVLCCAVPFALVYLLLSKSFIQLSTRTLRSSGKAKLSKAPLKAASPTAALLKKESGRFFSTPVYMLNAGLGSPLMIVVAVVMAVNGQKLFGQFGVEFFREAWSAMACLALCFCATIASTTSSSVSLEGRSLWALKSLPVRAWDVFRGKIALNLLVGLPAVFIAGGILAVAFRASLLETLVVILVPAAALTASAVLGLLVNLRMPRFDWVSETAVIKQSGSTMVCTFGAMGVLLTASIVYLVAGHALGAAEYAAIWGVAFAAAAAVSARYLWKHGERLMLAL